MKISTFHLCDPGVHHQLPPSQSARGPVGAGSHLSLPRVRPGPLWPLPGRPAARPLA
jgi:hypothetical protein